VDEDAPVIGELPDAIEDFAELWERFGGRVPALFLDYDGTLTGLVDDPADATIDAGTREVLQSLAQLLPTAVVSGRDTEDVRGLVALDDLAYAGSHGFDLRLGDGAREQYGTEFLDELGAAEQALRAQLEGIEGVRIERKGFAVAVHTRLVAVSDRGRVERVVSSVARDQPGLKVTGGKDIHELRPDIEWDKGRALGRLMDVLGLSADTHIPVYLGDDLTDEDGFAAIREAGVGIVVEGAHDRPTAARYRLRDPAAVRDFLRRVRDQVPDWTG
jgi:trehalose-phosphatase